MSAQLEVGHSAATSAQPDQFARMSQSLKTLPGLWVQDSSAGCLGTQTCTDAA